MKTYEEITIKIPSDVAEAYRRVPEEEREQIEIKLALLLDLQLKISHKEAVQKMQKTMESASDEAQKNGLTPEILESILAESN
ncbi:MAG: hypothetical protein SXA11_15500 [Cyanobacteriota bacterium]|nr:hypothetical protein [Cyanobacteriota bacterium]